MFNNGAVDACYSPAFGYQALELFKGIGDKGGVIRYPLAQMTMQLLIRSEDGYPEGFAQASRKLAYKARKKSIKMAKKAEKAIPEKHWIDISDADKARYDDMFQKVRIELRDNQKVYDGIALQAFRQIRCKAAPTRPECELKQE